jgi:hypothetical protein
MYTMGIEPEPEPRNGPRSRPIRQYDIEVIIKIVKLFYYVFRYDQQIIFIAYFGYTPTKLINHMNYF